MGDAVGQKEGEIVENATRQAGQHLARKVRDAARKAHKQAKRAEKKSNIRLSFQKALEQALQLIYQADSLYIHHVKKSKKVLEQFQAIELTDFDELVYSCQPLKDQFSMHINALLLFMLTVAQMYCDRLFTLVPHTGRQRGCDQRRGDPLICESLI
ncbi:hypothetical protein BV22DRAFT_1051049 [Leucogyrophana mollusca]|uniref:Uncharacterized protein n=1 Tax=Leucogyrophana mollusca TaxID=85980 RepID=A0ACB8B2G8_9AGAM|nr:hypothetical protein BV22DRAFT_1051049 [Leucogyrophana mollusca]